VKKVFVKTFGCQMNEADSDEMLSALMLRGYALADSPEDADVALVNTCTVRDHAEHRAFSYIGRLDKWKSGRDCRKVIVAGCAIERLGQDVLRQFPHVDLAAGAKSIDLFSELLDKAGIVGEGGVKSSCGARAYVTIMRGCSCGCAYCIVPSVRGPAVSLNPQEILAQANAKAAAGAKEITLLGQTVNNYRYPGFGDFAALLSEIHKIDGISRIRFMSAHPIFLNDSLIQAYADLPKLERHIHLPAQSGSDKILKTMRRGYTRQDFLDKLARLRQAAPGIAVSSDFIVGFPTETEEDFSQTLSLVDEGAISAAYCFKFSPRQSTVAYDMAGRPSNAEVDARLARLLEKVKSQGRNYLASLIGAKAELLMETDKFGRTAENFTAELAEGASAGTLVEAVVSGVRNNTLLVKRT